MDADDLRQVKDAIARILLEDCRAQFERIFQLTCELTKELPLQPNNEIRNAINHFGRALAAADRTEADRNLENARGHIIIATCDCLIISITNREQYLADLISSAEDREHQIFVGAREKLAEVRNLRRRIYYSGPRSIVSHNDIPTSDNGSLSRTCTALTKALTDFMALEEDLKDYFASPTLITRRKIEERAYAIWQREGSPENDGRDMDRWILAEQELRAEVQGTVRAVQS